jgi:hypothetical protein
MANVVGILERIDVSDSGKRTARESIHSAASAAGDEETRLASGT